MSTVSTSYATSSSTTIASTLSGNSLIAGDYLLTQGPHGYSGYVSHLDDVTHTHYAHPPKPRYKNIVGVVDKTFVFGLDTPVELTYAYQQIVREGVKLYKYLSIVVDVFGKKYRDQSMMFNHYSTLHDNSMQHYYNNQLIGMSTTPALGQHYYITAPSTGNPVNITTTGSVTTTATGMTTTDFGHWVGLTKIAGLNDDETNKIREAIAKQTQEEYDRLPENPDELKLFLTIDQMLTSPEKEIRFLGKQLMINDL